ERLQRAATGRFRAIWGVLMISMTFTGPLLLKSCCFLHSRPSNPTPRFRTIQVCPKDLPTALRQAERAVNRPNWPVGGIASGRKSPMLDMKRREFITLLGGAAAWPLAARAQRTTRPIVGFLNSASADKYAYLAAAFRQGLNDLGFVDGENITIEYRWAAGQYDRLSEMAADLVRREPAVIAANTPAVMPAKKATSTIPIVFFTAADPVEAGFVASLNRPGGNLTGISGLQSELGPKRLELLHELVPKATTFGLLVDPNNV